MDDDVQLVSTLQPPYSLNQPPFTQSEDTLASSSIGMQSQSQAQEHMTGLSMQAITQRDREITSIAESITDLAGLFKDLSTLVIDQGTLLDRIDYNVEQMATDMEAAVKELQTATTCVDVPLKRRNKLTQACRRYQRRSGKRQAICLLLLLIIGAIIVLVYKPKSSPGPADVPAVPQASAISLASEAGNMAAAWKHFPPDMAKGPG